MKNAVLRKNIPKYENNYGNAFYGHVENMRSVLFGVQASTSSPGSSRYLKWNHQISAICDFSAGKTLGTSLVSWLVMHGGEV